MLGGGGGGNVRSKNERKGRRLHVPKSTQHHTHAHGYYTLITPMSGKIAEFSCSREAIWDINTRMRARSSWRKTAGATKT